MLRRTAAIKREKLKSQATHTDQYCRLFKFVNGDLWMYYEHQFHYDEPIFYPIYTKYTRKVILKPIH